MFILRLSRIRLIFTAIAVLILTLGGMIIIKQQIKEVTGLNLPAPLEQVITDQKVITLTINVDWGEEYIPAILSVLNDYEAKATFFVTGRWVEKNPELLILIASQGHQIENHGYSHPHPDRLSVQKNKEELMITERKIMELTGRKPHFYAPPYGERGRNGLQAAKELGYTTVLWTLDTIDWQPSSTPELITQRILEPKMRHGIIPKKNGAIVLMHPKENTVRALPRILRGLKDEGYQVLTLEKLITYKLSGNTTS